MKLRTSLPIWKTAHGITMKAFRLAANFENDCKHKLADQVRESAIKQPVDLTEGIHQPSVEHFNRFMKTVDIEVAKLQYVLTLARDLNVATDREGLDAFIAELEEFKSDISFLQTNSLVHIQEVFEFGRQQLGEKNA